MFAISIILLGLYCFLRWLKGYGLIPWIKYRWDPKVSYLNVTIYPFKAFILPNKASQSDRNNLIFMALIIYFIPGVLILWQLLK